MAVHKPEKNNPESKDAIYISKNCGSSSSQITYFTKKIKYLSEHIKKNKKDHVTKFSLIKTVNQRKKMLKYLKKKDKNEYLDLIKKLSIRR